VDQSNREVEAAVLGYEEGVVAGVEVEVEVEVDYLVYWVVRVCRAEMDESRAQLSRKA
jgi:hypothetical protein